MLKGVLQFGCHLESCPRLFLTPKARRLHLIEAHGFPKEYFFAVTNKGIGGLLKKWGEGASMIRGPWKARVEEEEEEKEVINKKKEEEELVKSMGSLSLVPPSIRFGRGGKNGGFVTRR
jgi:hypothetical protein